MSASYVSVNTQPYMNVTDIMNLIRKGYDTYKIRDVELFIRFTSKPAEPEQDRKSIRAVSLINKDYIEIDKDIINEDNYIEIIAKSLAIVLVEQYNKELRQLEFKELGSKHLRAILIRYLTQKLLMSTPDALNLEHNMFIDKIKGLMYDNKYRKASTDLDKQYILAILIVQDNLDCLNKKLLTEDIMNFKIELLNLLDSIIDKKSVGVERVGVCK